MSHLVSGLWYQRIAATRYSGTASFPCPTLWPRYSNSAFPHVHLLGFTVRPCSLSSLSFVKVALMWVPCLGKYYDVVNVNTCKQLQSLQCLRHVPLECCRSISKAEGHSDEFKVFPWGTKCSLRDISLSHLDLIEALVEIKLR